MSIITHCNALLHRATGLRVVRHEQRGASFARDVARDLPMLRMTTILDVGANIGQSAHEYLDAFRLATVHSIEPASATYNGLVARFAGSDRFFAYRLGLGASAGEFRLSTVGPSETFHIADADETGSSEVVTVHTLDDFIAANNLGQVDFLKIDTEGNDLDVLRGGAATLAAQGIGLIQVEAGMNPDNTRHISLHAMASYLEGFGYRVFGIYEQIGEFLSGRPNLRRVNAVFVSPAVIEANRRQGLG